MLHRVSDNVDTDQWAITSRELTVENTTYCGAECVMCPRDEYKTLRNWVHMPTNLFNSSIDQGIELGITSVDLCGFGDPFIDPGYEAKLEYVKTRYPSIRTYTSTTGHVMHPKNLPWIKKYFDTIKISNYGFSKESYEAIHKGVVKFEKVWENVNALLDVPRGERPYVILSFLVFPENEHEMEAWQEYWEPKADEVMIWRPHNFGGSERIETLAYHSEARQESETTRSCGRPKRGNPYIRANGDVSVCCFDFNHNLVVGNLNEAPLLDILKAEELRNVQRVHDELGFKGCGLICESCDQIQDRSDALMYSSNESRNTDQPTSHPDHDHRFVERPLLAS